MPPSFFDHATSLPILDETDPLICAMMFRFVLLLASFFASMDVFAQELDTEVKVAGAMRNVMWQGQLEAAIDLDTISAREHLYGIGPLSYLSGELIIVDGKIFTATVAGEGMKVEEGSKAGAPFFVYAQNKNWKEMQLPDSVTGIGQLEQLLVKLSTGRLKPFLFKLEGMVHQAQIHLVNLPPGTRVSSPEDAHQGKKDFILNNTAATMIGFFSAVHKGIFTHHDRLVHIHLISADKKQAGHLDEVHFKPGAVKLFLALHE